MVRVGPHAADHDRAAGQIGEAGATHLDGAAAQADPAVVRIRVVADPQRDLTELGEVIVIEHDAGRGGDLHGGGLLVPAIAHRLERPAAP